MVNRSVDIVIVGAGLAGASLAIALINHGFNPLLIEAKSLNTSTAPSFDARTVTLSPASQSILKHMNLWENLASHVTPITAINVSSQYHFGRTRLQGNAKPLGFTIPIQVLYQTILKQLPAAHLVTNASVTHYDKETQCLTFQKENQPQTIQPQLIVAADGTESAIRALSGLTMTTKDYHQHALVTNVGLSRDHENIAYERFTPSGPLALLPSAPNRSALVWGLSPEDAFKWQQANDAEFLSYLQHTFGYKLGRFTRIGQRFIYPLRQTIMPVQASWPIVFIGNAAQTLHPVAGQGFNLGLRDVATLTHCLAKKGLGPAMLEHYKSLRIYDRKSILQLTDGLVRLFSNKNRHLGLLRSFGLMTIDNLSFLQKKLLCHAQGFAGTLPDFVYPEEA